MIIHAPHQFPQNIRYTIFCSSLFDNIENNSINKTTAFTPFTQELFSKLEKLVTKLFRSKKLEQQLRNIKNCDPQLNKKEIELALQLKTILATFCPSSECIGFQNTLHKQINDHFIVLFAWNWHRVKNALMENGWREEKILLLPVPESDYWAYWNNVYLFLSDPTGDINHEKTLQSQVFLNYLTNQCVLVPNESRLEYRKYTDSSTQGLERGHQLYPFPAFAVDAISRNLEKINKVKNKLSDDRSKKIYESVLFGEPNERFLHFFNNTITTLQYFEYININPGDCILNAGVASGFEIPFFSAHLNNRGQIHCIDPEGFDHLSHYVRAFCNNYPHLLFEHRYVLCDRSTGKSPQPLLGDFSNYVPITIDDLVESNRLTRVDLIKMDVEAMEALALTKISNTITKFRPQLAIAIYHEIEHFWDLPIQIINMCEDYDFYFNIYSPLHFEGIFYAIPREKT